jgi:hypothetical protein
VQTPHTHRTTQKALGFLGFLGLLGFYTFFSSYMLHATGGGFGT